MKKILLLLLLPIITLAQKECVIHVTTDQYPTETYWTLFADSLNGDTIAMVPAGHYTSPNTSYTDTCYINDTIADITFLMRDTYGDGMNGSYYVTICGDTIVNYPNPNFQSGIYSNRQVPSCLPPPPPPPPGPCVPTLVNINLDQYPEETSWTITDSLGNIVFSGGPYNNVPDYEPQFQFACLPPGELTFTIYDLYGDGLEGTLWGGQDGSYYVMQCGDTVVYGIDPSFGQDSAHVFISDTCIPPPPVYGCMDDDYVEHDPLATVDDSSCATLKIYGCIDSTMYNYDPLANTMDDIDQCTYDLILHDLVGNGWVATRLEIWQDADTSIFYMNNSSFNQAFTIDLFAPSPVYAKLFVSQQAQATAIECGFTLIGPDEDTIITIQPPFIVPFFMYEANTYCGNTCEEIVYGCLDSLAFNYIDTANTADNCYYYPGCISPAYLEYHVDTANAYYTDINIQDSCETLAMFGCTDSTAFNYDTTANVDNGGCLPIVAGCMDAFAFNYNVLANTPDTCIPFVYGCTNPTALNYDTLANTDDNSCVFPIFGCTDPQAFNYDPQANVDDGSCIAKVFGCTDPTMFNYDQLANVDNGSCIPFVYGCTDSTAFNYNPLANADNNSCAPFIYGCTDPSALNYSPQANTEDFSCIAYIYGCMDSLALNYDPLANTDNGSCISVVMGCMDQTAYNYNGNANVDDPVSCLYSAGCVTGDSIPYWLNDPCYAWVIDIDKYCCDNEWDTICQATYNYCEGTWVGPLPTRIQAEKKLVGVTDLLGRETKIIKNKLLLFIYNDGSVIKQLIKK
ncbi:hypothetical protein OAV33_00850 [bacterium]|nr:hypothetical protein [bacterium]